MDQRTWFPKQIIADQVFSKDDLESMWNAIDWADVRESVFRQQCDIARAALEGDGAGISRLQDELVNSDDAKALAVWEVVHRKSRATPGVDGVVWETPAQRMSAALHLNNEGYESLPLLRFFIPKESGKLRPIGIPTMHDRAMQMLYNFALQPVAETWGDPHSFGYRLFRSAKDACAAIRSFLAGEQGDDIWVLDADITGCFDNIRHDWLLKHIPVSRDYLRQVLKSGYIHESRYFRTSRGIPQGGIISPVLANMTLDGLEPRLMKAFSRPVDTTDDRQAAGAGLRYVRYADDFVVLSSARGVLEEAWDEINAFLKPRGLTLSDEKTRIVSVRHGFTFLHWRFRKEGSDIPVRPSDGSVHHMRQILKELFGSRPFSNPDELIQQFNPLLRGYAFYHRDVEAGELFRSLDECIREKILALLSCWFPNESRESLEGRFFSCGEGGLPVFNTTTQSLYLLTETPLRMHQGLEPNLNAFLDRDRLMHREEQGDPLDRAVYRERIKSREEGRKYGVPEYW
ncbi:MAG: Reverse transcriptase (RNA-dependent DNA polymerase) [Methanoregula sp. PtaU1.Bin051]|nr:MAG: Reverse transcriptase (RNA-dependent DNA polymerase) [Methanoregula sp. PtaU1.Bin051]